MAANPTGYKVGTTDLSSIFKKHYSSGIYAQNVNFDVSGVGDLSLIFEKSYSPADRVGNPVTYYISQAYGDLQNAYMNINFVPTVFTIYDNGSLVNPIIYGSYSYYIFSNVGNNIGYIKCSKNYTVNCIVVGGGGGGGSAGSGITTGQINSTGCGGGGAAGSYSNYILNMQADTDNSYNITVG